MSAEEHRFRGAVFGFNRQDVIHYIESIHRDYATQLQSMKKELEQERAQRSTVEQQGSLAGQEAAAAEKDAQRAKEELARLGETLRQAQSEREDLRLRLQTTEKDLADLRAAAQRMAPAARAYEALKDKAATIELDAHNRAQVIVKTGEEEAAQTRREVTEWLRQVESSYVRLKADVAATLSHAVAELDRTGKSLDKVTQELDSHGQRLHAISAELEAHQSEPPRPSAPETEGK